MAGQEKFSELSSQLGHWDGISERGERIYDGMFEAEMQMMDEYETKMKYAGMDYEEKQEAMRDEYNEMVAENAVYDYYND